MTPSEKIVLTLDAGGTNFVFSAICSGKPIGISVTKPSHGNNLSLCLQGIVDGFREVANSISNDPVAISFAFPGPADYNNGIIGNLGNLPAFRGGVSLGPMLEDAFGVPVYINNDGDLFAYGEAILGFLPFVNSLLEKSNNPRRYQNLLGVTLGTGFGAGFVTKGELFVGDNSAGAEIWVTRSMINPQCFAEEEISIRAVKRNYAHKTGKPQDLDLTPKDIAEIAAGVKKGNRAAAIYAYEQFGAQLGDSLANAITLLDCNVVIGGGLANAYNLFAPAMMAHLNGKIVTYNGVEVDRMEVKAFNLEDDGDRKAFLSSSAKTIAVPNSSRKISYDEHKKIGIGLSKLTTSNAISLGAWAFAMQKLATLNLKE